MAFEKQFTPEQEVKLEDHINYKSQGFITSLGQDKAQRLAKSVDNKMFGTFTDTLLVYEYSVPIINFLFLS